MRHQPAISLRSSQNWNNLDAEASRLRGEAAAAAPFTKAAAVLSSATPPAPAAAEPPAQAAARPLTVFAFFGAFVEVTERMRALGGLATAPIRVANDVMSCGDPAPGLVKFLFVLYDDGSGLLHKAGTPEGASAAPLAPRSRLLLALYGAVNDVSEVVRARARAPAFEMPVRNETLGGDPARNIPKALLCAIGGGVGRFLCASAREGQVLRMDVTPISGP